MAKANTNPITSIETPWEGRAGSCVERFLKDQLKSKVGASYLDSNTNILYFFASTADRASWLEDPTQSELVISSALINVNSNLVYRVLMTNNNGTTDINTAANVPELNLSIDFDVQLSTLGSSDWTSSGQGVIIRCYSDLGSTGTFTEVPVDNNFLIAGQTFTLNVMKYMAPGTNRFKVEMYAEGSSTTFNSITYSVNVSEMYVELMNNTWYQPVIEGNTSSYKLGGFKVVGDLSKTIHFDVYAEGSNTPAKTFTKLLGSATYIDAAYNFLPADGFNLSGLQSGEYKVDVYLTSDTLESTHVTYNFMYVTASDSSTAKLIVINNVADSAYNYTTSTLCQYSVYNGGLSTADVDVTVALTTDGVREVKVDDTYEGVTTGVLNNFTYSGEISTESTNITLDATIGIGEDVESISMPFDNSSTYPAEAGSVFYMNASTRNNAQTNKDKIINLANDSEITPVWSNIDFVDGIDGWTTDANGRKALLIPAGSSVEIPYQALYHGEDTTFEIAFKAANVADYDENIITVATNPTLANFAGIRIKPTNVTVHSYSDTTATNDTERGTNFRDEAVQHFLLSITKNYGGNNGKNLVTGFLNGCKAFQFDYLTGTIWVNNSNIKIGSQKTDIYVYLIRSYEKALGAAAAEQNYINSMPSLEDRAITAALFQSAINASTREISYDKMIAASSTYNFFVVDMLNGASIPSRANGWSKDSKGYSNFEMHFGEHPEWDFKLYNVETSGQGTTSMDYYRWNLRFRIDKSNDTKKVDVAYYDAPTTSAGKKRYNEQLPTSSKTVYFDGGANGSTQQHPALKRITAKINMASSMQSHKMGGTGAFNALHDYMGLQNEAQQIDPTVSVAVYEYPAFGFAKRTSATGVDTYTFIGLFTIGPDKGDKPTFGYDKSPETLISLEGTDHSRKMATFSYPWNSDVHFLASNECINIVKGNNDYDNGLEVGNCHDLSTDKATDQASIELVLEEQFKPAYNVAFQNSTLIFPIALNDAIYGASTAAGVLANINANKTAFLATQYNSRLTYAAMQFWIEGEYTLYYYDIVANEFKPDINLVTQNGAPTGATLNEQNEWFKTQRRNRFKSEAPNYWDIQDSIFHLCFLVIFGATDNFAKNSYPYKMALLADDGRWKWRQDDLDTIFDIDNTGSQTKPYYIEYLDTANGSTYFAGSVSAFWNLLYEAFWNDYGTSMGIESFGKAMLNAMSALANGANVKDGCVAFMKKYFWDKAQEYFPASTYNIDGQFKYETAWLTNGQNVNPLTQSLGNHYEAEMLWVERRVIYAMSLFKAGPFGLYSDTSLGTIMFDRPYNLPEVKVKPMMWIYPAFIEGAGSPTTTSRTAPGEVKTFIGPFSTEGQTRTYIQATNQLSELGNLKDLILAQGYTNPIQVNGKKLQKFEIGYDSTVNSSDAGYVAPKTNVPGLSFPDNPCLEQLYAKYASSLTGYLDLTNLPRLKEAILGGTSFTQIAFKEGSKIDTIELPDTLVYLWLSNLQHIETITLPADLSSIVSLKLENCDTINALQIFKDIYDANGDLKYIRLKWNEEISTGKSILDVLQNIANNSIEEVGSETGYGGIDASGNATEHPYIEGTLTTSDTVTANQVYDVAKQFPELNIQIPDSQQYIVFEDPEVERICLANYDTNSDGVLQLGEAKAVTSQVFGNTVFRGNTTIETFDELKYFTGMNHMPGSSNSAQGPFSNCTSLKTITLPSSITNVGHNYGCSFFGCTALEEVKNFGNVTSIGYGSFQNCTSLKSIDLSGVTMFDRSGAFYNCSSLAIELNMPRLMGWEGNSTDSTFYNSGITKIINLGSTVSLPNTTFKNCKSLTEAHLPTTLTTIGNDCFSGDTALTTVTGCENVTSIGNYAFACGSISNSSQERPGHLESADFDFSKITSIGENAFQGQRLDGIINAPNLTFLGNGAFHANNITKVQNLGLITTLNTSTSTDSGIFKFCTNLTEAHLPLTVTEIGNGDFMACAQLETIDGWDNITSIKTYAFSYCHQLVNITIPEKVESLGTNAFSHCNNLTTISLPQSCTSIGQECFVNSPITNINLEYIEQLGSYNFRGNTTFSGPAIMSSVVSISTGCFRNCTCEEYTIGPNCTSIGNYCFIEPVGSKKTVKILATTPPTLGGSSVFNTGNTTVKIYVPYGYASTYQSATGWSAYASKIQELDENGNIPE